MEKRNWLHARIHNRESFDYGRGGFRANNVDILNGAGTDMRPRQVRYGDESDVLVRWQGYQY